GESTSLEAPGPAPPPRGNPHVTRLLAGTAALLVPNFLAGPLGLFDVGGGRGLLWFTDLDTLVFDAALVFAILSVVAAGAGSLRRPLLWLVAPLTIVLGGLLAYSVTNVGTLFRLRAMVYTGIVLIPLAAARSEPS
ncbi:MAG TPA: hypothetical protein VFO89_08480, partial [Thermoanaerobaculia bacterium]|nr:hypothetical protein [Thermoanaerobaculia bacterium]